MATPVESPDTDRAKGNQETTGPDSFYESRVNSQKSAMGGQHPFDDPELVYPPDGVELENHSRADDLIRGRIQHYEVDGRYVLGVKPSDLTAVEEITGVEARQLLEREAAHETYGILDYAGEHEGEPLYIRDATVGGDKQRVDVPGEPGGEIWF